MKTIKSTSGKFSIILLLAIIFNPFFIQAQKSFKSSLSQDQTNSFFIIGGVLVLAIGAYIAYSILERNKKSESPSKRRAGLQRHQHHHKVVKKSA